MIKYLNRSSKSCQQALERKLSPPPGLNKIDEPKQPAGLNQIHKTIEPLSLNKFNGQVGPFVQNEIHKTIAPPDLNKIHKQERPFVPNAIPELETLPDPNKIHKQKASFVLNEIHKQETPPDLNKIHRQEAPFVLNGIHKEKEPPGLNEMHVRSSKDLWLKVLKLRIDSPNKCPDHIPLPLHWSLFVGMGFIALVMTGILARRRRLMQTACTLLGLPARHLRLDSRSSRLLAETGTSTGDLDHSERNRAGFSGYDLASRKISKAIASRSDQGKEHWF